MTHPAPPEQFCPIQILSPGHAPGVSSWGRCLALAASLATCCDPESAKTTTAVRLARSLPSGALLGPYTGGDRLAARRRSTIRGRATQLDRYRFSLDTETQVLGSFLDEDDSQSPRAGSVTCERSASVDDQARVGGGHGLRGAAGQPSRRGTPAMAGKLTVPVCLLLVVADLAVQVPVHIGWE